MVRLLRVRLALIKIAPSILSADFSSLGNAVREAEDGGADYIHIDVMDGHFVPNLTVGPPVVAAIRRATRLPLDVHLMVEAPEDFLEDFANAGANIVSVHVEACRHLHRAVQHLRDLGVKPSITLNPMTGLETLWEVLPFVDQVLVMTVNPGFAGQSYIPTMKDKVRRLAEAIADRHASVEIEVDGGIGPDQVTELVEVGARVFVAGTAVFHHPAGIAAGISALRHAAAKDHDS